MVQLPVERLPSAESGRNIACVDPLILKQDDVADGAVVELTTQRARRLLARAVARAQDEGRGCVRLDRFQIQFLKPDLREKITLTAVNIEEAKRLAPGWDVHALEEDWRAGVHEKNVVVPDPDAHFLGFCKKRGAYPR